MAFDLELSNFQGFSETQAIPLSPITLVFGPNSSGKSSIIRSLLLAGQTAPNWSKVNWAGKLVNLSSFRNTVYSHDLSRRVGLGFNLGSTAISYSPNVSFKIENTAISWEIGKESTPDVLRIELTLEPNRKPVILVLGVSASNEFRTRTQWALNSSESKNLSYLATWLIAAIDEKKLSNSSKGHNPRSWVESWNKALFYFDDVGNFVAEGTEVYQFLPQGTRLQFWTNMAVQDKAGAFFQKKLRLVALLHVIQESIGALNARFESIRHVGPYRVIDSNPEVVDTSKASYLQSDGSNLGKALTPAMVDQISEWLTVMTDGQYSAKVVKITSAQADLLGAMQMLVLRDNHTKSDVQLKDVGSGLSQIIPVLYNLAVARQEDYPLVLLQQPELHLHPKMQVHLAELLRNSIEGERYGKPTIVVETHSENLILRFQRMIRNGELKPEDISVIYVDREIKASATKPGRNSVRVLEIDSSGEFLTDWPTSFSDLRLREVLG